MTSKCQLIFITIAIFAVLVLYTNAMTTKRIIAPKDDGKLSQISDEEKNHGRQHKKLKSPAKPRYSNSKKASKAVVVESVVEDVPQPSTPMIEENALLPPSNSESMDDAGTTENGAGSAMDTQSAVAAWDSADPKSQLHDLLEMNETLQWEMAVRSEDEQIIDLEDDLEWFPAFIFERLESFVRNVPDADEQKAQLGHLLANWKADKQTLEVEQQTEQLEQIGNSLNTFSEQLRESNMSTVKATPAILDIALDIANNESHEAEKMEFLWQMVNRKPTRYVKNVGQFFGAIQIAMAYLHQAVQVGQWAHGKHFLAPEQLAALTDVVGENLPKLANLQTEMATKMGIDLADFGMGEMLAQTVPSLEHAYTSNLQNNLDRIRHVAQLEDAQFNDAQIGTYLVLNALSAVSVEVNTLMLNLLGIQITWPTFHAVGEVSKVAEVLQQIQQN